MHSTFERICITALIAVLLLMPAGTPADEAVLPNGLRIQGALRPGPQAQLQFLTASRTLNLSQLHMVRFPSGSPRPRPTRATHRFTLTGGQHITGELIELSANLVRVLPVWSVTVLAIPRSSVRSISQPPGEITLLAEDFETDLAAWTTRGEPALSERKRQSGRKSLLLNAPGQKLEYVLPTPVKTGRLTLSYFAEVPMPTGARWVVDAEFAGAELPVRISVELAGPAGTRMMEAPGLDRGNIEAVPLLPAPWHRLDVEWRSDSLVVQVDAKILHHANRGPTGPLRKLRLRCLNGPAAIILGGEVWIGDLLLTRFVDELPRPSVDPEQDDVWLAAGDQLFGTVIQADRRTIRLQGRLGERTLSWANLRAIHLRPANSPIRTSVGEYVKVWLGEGKYLDELEGIVTALDERKVTIQHPVLGALTLDRDWLRQLQWRFSGRRIELDNVPHHLGQHLLPESLRPEGMSLRRTFTMPANVSAGRLQVTVAHLPAPGDDSTVDRMLARGGLRTEVLLNGRVIDYLNRHVTRSSALPQILTITLPVSAIRAGDNVLELRQTVDQESGRSADCVISGLVVEIPGQVSVNSGR